MLLTPAVVVNVAPDNEDYVFSLMAAKKDVNITLSESGEELIKSMLEKDGFKYDECINVWYISFKKIDSLLKKNDGSTRKIGFKIKGEK